MKTYVFDAGALLVFIQNKAGALRVTELIKDAIRGRAQILMSAVNYGEVYGWVLRTMGFDRGAASMNVLYSLPIHYVDATSQHALKAAEVKAKYKLYYVDSFAAALAIECKGTLVTSDSDFRRLGHNFPIVWLKA